MATDSQKASGALEPTDQNLIKEFIGIKRPDELGQYEKAHQTKILGSSIYVRDAFDKHWKDVNGNFYFSPITLKTQADDGGRTLHPRSTNYKVGRTFNSVRWKKRVAEIPIKDGKTRQVINFDTFGVEVGSLKQVTIERNLSPNGLNASVGETLAQAILRDSKKAGSFDGEIPLEPPQQISVIGYWEVIFAPSGSKEDPEDVTLTHNGNCLQIKRQERVVLPGYYLEVADHGTYPKFIQTPEQSRKIVGWVQFFPYSVLKEATEEEYLAQVREGNRLTAEARRRETVLQ